MSSGKRRAEHDADAETLFVRKLWAEMRERDGIEAKVMARRVGVAASAISQLVNGKNGLGRSIAGWAKALGFRSVEEFRIAAYRWYLAVYELRERDSGTHRIKGNSDRPRVAER